MSHSGPPAENEKSNTAIVHKVFKSSAAFVAAIGSKIKSLRGNESLGNENLNEQRRASKALDSLKIQLRILSDERDFAAVRQIAESTGDAEIASIAISYLSEIEHAETINQLGHIARSHSRACIPALISLFNKGEPEIAEAILLQRLQNGDYFKLLNDGMARPMLLMDVLGAVDDYRKSSLCLQYFPSVWKCLDARPEEQEGLLAEILGDPNPAGMRYSPESNMIRQDVKIQAMQLLHALEPVSYERSLWYATRDEDDVVAYTATMALIDHWQHEGSVPAHLEPFPMLNLNLLFYLSKLASTFQWKGPAGVMEQFKEFEKEAEEFAGKDPSADLVAYQTELKRLENKRADIKKITDQRLNALQPIVDGVTKSLALPHAKIRSTDVPGVAASYIIGAGTVEFSTICLLDDKPLTEEFMSSMLHELGHMEQDVLIIRMIADEIGLLFGQHGSKLKILFEKYSDAIGYAPDSIFLLEVLRLRRDVPLTPAELSRAQRLIDSARQNAMQSQNGKRVQERMDRIEESIFAMEGGEYDLELLACLQDENSFRPLFESGFVPAVLLEEIRLCRSLIEDYVDRVGNLSGVKAKDKFAYAQQLYPQIENNEDPLKLTLRRFIVVVVSMLSEEYRHLERRRSEIRRAGYHEAEAYTISDRVEVIVKALRKNWYEFV